MYYRLSTSHLSQDVIVDETITRSLESQLDPEHALMTSAGAAAAGPLFTVEGLLDSVQAVEELIAAEEAHMVEAVENLHCCQAKLDALEKETRALEKLVPKLRRQHATADAEIGLLERDIRQLAPIASMLHSYINAHRPDITCEYPDQVRKWQWQLSQGLDKPMFTAWTKSSTEGRKTRNDSTRGPSVPATATSFYNTSTCGPKGTDAIQADIGFDKFFSPNSMSQKDVKPVSTRIYNPWPRYSDKRLRQMGLTQYSPDLADEAARDHAEHSVVGSRSRWKRGGRDSRHIDS